MKKQLLVIGAVTAIGAAGLTGISIAHAAANTSGNGPMSGLVDAIASKFNLNKSEVQSVFDQQHTQMEADREASVKNELAQLVKDGKLTQAQADALNAKRTELQKEREANRTADRDLTADQRKAKMTEHRTATDTWLKEQGIDTKYSYLLMGGRGGHGGPGGMHGTRGNR